MLDVVSSSEALEIILNSTEYNPRCTKVPLDEALGLVCAEDIESPEDLPAFARSTVDGYAVHASDTYGCSESIPAMLEYDGEIMMGETPELPLPLGHCMKIPTGGNLPEGADAVCMIEYTDDIGDEFRYIYKPVSVLENVNNRGDDIGIEDLVTMMGEKITSRNTALLAALGISEIKVLRPIKAAIISTGDELIDYWELPTGAQIRNINSVMLSAQLRELGAEVKVFPIIRDELAKLESAVSKALSECDIVLISGGSSVGEKDNTYKVLGNLGDIKFHGISIKPGKPTIFALADGKPIFGLPGHPQAAYFIFRLFATPLIRKMMLQDTAAPSVSKLLSRNIPSNHGREEIVPVVINGDYAVPLHAKSGVVSVLNEADGYIRVDRNAEGLREGAEVEVFIF